MPEINSSKKENLPKILVTGASGFLGHYFLDRIKDHFLIFALERRIPQNSPLISHHNINWISADIGNMKSLSKAKDEMLKVGGVDFILHLAGYYDFNYDENPEYQRTNIDGTKNILEIAKDLHINRFIFASSVAACEFPAKGKRINERTPTNAKFAYARSKNIGEKMVKEYSKFFNTCSVRFAAIFSDWCEYGPLYIFLTTWLSKGWKAKILGGKGQSAITYIHVNCVIELLLKIITKSNSLPSNDTYIASPEEPVSHKELFIKSTKYFYGKPGKPIYMPKSIATLGVYVMDFFGKLIGKRPFERPWMMQYLDRQLKVNSNYTREQLGWRPAERYIVQRRLLFMIEHMRSYPYEWQKRNQKMFKSIALVPNFKIAEKLESIREDTIDQIVAYLCDDQNSPMFPTYRNISLAQLKKDTQTLYQFLSVSIRSRDRVSALAYAEQIAEMRYQQGFMAAEVVNAIDAIGDIIRKRLYLEKELEGMKQEIYDEITFTFQLMVDEIEGTYEQILREKTPLKISV